MTRAPIRSPADSAGRRMSASGRVWPVGALQSTGTVRAPHWKPSPQSDHNTVESKRGSGAQVVVVMADGLARATAGTSEPAAIDTTNASAPTAAVTRVIGRAITLAAGHGRRRRRLGRHAPGRRV